MTISDEEISKKVIKAINDAKVARTAFRKIHERINNICLGTPEKEEYTIISKNELAYLKNIEKILFEIDEYVEKIYKHLRGNNER